MNRAMRLFLAVLAMGALTLPMAAAAQEPAEPPPPAASPRTKVIHLGGAAPATAPPLPLQAPPPRSQSVPLTSPSLAGETVTVAVNKTHELTLPTEARDIIVGSADVIDVLVRSPTQVFVVGRAIGQSNIIFRDKNGQAIRRIEVSVTVDVETLRDVLHKVLPGETSLQVSAISDSIYLSGFARSDGAIATARQLARSFVKEDRNVVVVARVGAEQQVLMQVKVAEIQKSVLKELGVSTSLLSGKTIPALGATAYLPTTNGTTGLTSTTFFGTLNVVGIDSLSSNFSMLESQGLLKTLVEPNLTAVSGETASMLAGGEFPVPVSVNNGQIGIEFKPFGIGLNFTPVVIDGGRLSLKMQSEVSDVDKTFSVAVSNSVTVYGLKVRRAASVVEMPSGGAIMIAGLLQNDVTQAMTGIPGIMDIPVLGALFRSNSFQRKESELVVIVSAYIVQPMSASQASLPTDGFAPSSDADRFLYGRLQEIYTKDRGTSKGQLEGPIGYIVQ